MGHFQLSGEKVIVTINIWETLTVKIIKKTYMVNFQTNPGSLSGIMVNRLALQDKRNLPDVITASSDFETFRNLLENESSTKCLLNQASI